MQVLQMVDSLDEAELRQESLGRALRKLSHYLGNAQPRAKLLVSCRVSDWGTASGLADYMTTFGGQCDLGDLQILQLMPLSNPQLKQLPVSGRRMPKWLVPYWKCMAY
jgi:hypothetical protein